MDAIAEKPKTINSLIGDIEDYIRRGEHSGDEAQRWFCKERLEPLLTIARQIRSGGLDVEHKRAIADFRAGEITREIARRQRDLRQLEDDLKAQQKKATA